MSMMIRTGMLVLVASAMIACGGSAGDRVEDVVGGSSQLKQKEGEGKKDPGTADGKEPGSEEEGLTKGGACFAGAEGGETSCKTAEVWKQYAIDTCEAKGATLVDIGLAVDCEKGSYRYAKFECCAKADPANMPPKGEQDETPPKDGQGDPSSPK